MAASSMGYPATDRVAKRYQPPDLNSFLMSFRLAARPTYDI